MRILITGGTGSLGRALVARLAPNHELTVYSRDEVKQSDMRRAYRDADVEFMLGDVRDPDRLALAMRAKDVVLHVGAYKQVPSAEANVDEAIATNVQGSLNVARAAVHADVEFVVGVSTDKACAPINAYGQTKALMERLFQQADTWADTIFNCVRYGNVLGSRGSIVPLFREQARTGRYTLTDPEMTRFWMTLEQAVDLVLTPVFNPHVSSGDVLVPQCSASTMMDMMLACALKWGSWDVGQDTPAYDVIGTRPGEKKHENLIHVNESSHMCMPDDDVPYYQIVSPLVDGESSDGPADFEYRSDTAPRLSVEELVGMLDTVGDDRA